MSRVCKSIQTTVSLADHGFPIRPHSPIFGDIFESRSPSGGGSTSKLTRFELTARHH